MSDAEPRSGVETVSVDGLATYLRCPRQYAFAHEDGLEAGDDDTGTERRVALLRTAICDALRRDVEGRDALVEVATRRLETLWDDSDQRFHSHAQRRHERRVLEATLEAYVDRVGLEHARGIERLEDDADEGELIGPGLPVSSTVALPERGDEPANGGDGSVGPVPEAVTIDAAVDYVYADGSSVTGVRFVPTLAPLGLLRYRSEWKGDVAGAFTDHFDPDADVFEPTLVGTLFETAVVVDGLRDRCKRLGLSDRTCRYVRIPLAEHSNTAVNWVRGTVETTLETVDLTDVYVDHHSYGMTHEHRNRTVDDRLAAVVAGLVAGGDDPTDRWEVISRECCPDCEYAVCCGEYIAAEVRFDG